MAKNGHTEIFQTIFPKKTGINLEWPFQIFSNNFCKKDWYKFGMAKNGHSEFFLTIFPEKTGINSEFFPTISPKKTGINSEWPKMHF